MAKKKTKIGQLLSNVGSAISNVAHGVVSVGEDIPYAPLLPFKKAMTRALDQRKIAHTSTLHDISKKFVSGVLHKNFDDRYAFGLCEGEELRYADSSNLIDDAIQIIQLVISFFKNLASKPANQLTEDEKIILSDANESAAVVITAANNTPGITTSPSVVAIGAGSIADKLHTFIFSDIGFFLLIALALIIAGAAAYYFY